MKVGVVATGNISSRPNGYVPTVTTQNGATVLAVLSGRTKPVEEKNCLCAKERPLAKIIDASGHIAEPRVLSHIDKLPRIVQLLHAALG